MELPITNESLIKCLEKIIEVTMTKYPRIGIATAKDMVILRWSDSKDITDGIDFALSMTCPERFKVKWICTGLSTADREKLKFVSDLLSELDSISVPNKDWQSW